MNIFKSNKVNKKRTELQGNIIFPLIIGQRAVILCSKQTISTSLVEEIHEVSGQRIIIETKNTIYCIIPACSGVAESYATTKSEIFVS